MTRRSLTMLILASLAACREGAGAAQTTLTPLRFYAVAELTKSRSATPEISGGRTAEPSDWPASFYAKLDGEYCTSTAVGPQVLLTAAHCVIRRPVTVTLNGSDYDVVCERAPQYTTSEKADWALCALDRVLPTLPYEVVSITPSAVQLHEDVLLTGFGCDGTPNSDDVFRIGESTVHRLPSGSDYDIVTRGGAAVCFGDSGGATYRVLKGRRIQVAVNSRTGPQPAESLLSSLAAAPAITFLKNWSSRHNVVICGIHSGVRGCRS